MICSCGRGWSEVECFGYWDGYFDATAEAVPLFALIEAIEGDDWLAQDIAMLAALNAD